MEDVDIRVQHVAQTIFNAWPMWVFTIVSTCLAGLCMWTLVCIYSMYEFATVSGWDAILTTYIFILFSKVGMLHQLL